MRFTGAREPSRGEHLPYDNGLDYSSWVYTIRDSAWLAERHAYEQEHYETPLLETYQHYLFCFHDDFVEAIAEGVWFDVASADDPFRIDRDHPLSAAPFTDTAKEGVAHGLPWAVRTTDRPASTTLAASAFCSQRLFDFILRLDGEESVSASALLRTREGRTRTHLTMPWWVGVVASVDGVAGPDDFAGHWDEYCREVAQRRREMGK